MKHLFQPSEEELCEHYPNRHERRADMIVHATAIGAAVVGGSFLVVMALIKGGLSLASSTAIYAICLLAMLIASNIYNLRKAGPERRLLRRLDEAAIFLLIAGSYTPFLIVTLRGPWGWSLFGVVWGLALIGVVLKFWFAGRFNLVSTIIYVGLGWIVLIALKPLMAALPSAGLLLLFAGGICYTGGAAFYLWERLPYHHAIWHLWVLGGSVCHWAAVFFYIVPRAG